MSRTYSALFRRLDLIHWCGKTVFSHAIHLCAYGGGGGGVMLDTRGVFFVCARAAQRAFEYTYLIGRHTFLESEASGSAADEGHE